MAKVWSGSLITGTQSSIVLDNNLEILYNNSALGPTVRKFDLTVVAREFMCISDTDDPWTVRWIVVHELHPTLTVSAPGDSDENVRGIFPFARGPVYFSPRAKISVPPDHKLFLQVQKKSGSASSTYFVNYRMLVVDSPT